MLPDKTLQIAKDIIMQSAPGVLGIYLYGSFNTLYQTSESDLDLAVLAKEKMDNVQRWELSQHIARAIDNDVDLIDLKQASTVLKFQIISTGKRILCADANTCEAFEDLVYSKYLHFSEERAKIIEDIISRKQVY